MGKAWGLSVLFGVFGVVAVYSLYFVKAHVPETKGMSLEAIERFLAGERPGRSPSIQSPLITSAGDAA